MNAKMIEMFLAIIETRSLSKAAEKMYLSQSTLSNRLTALEDEIGTPLVLRAQGHRWISLTPKGEEFVIFASRYASLMKDIDVWKREDPRYNLKISCPPSLNCYVLPPFFTNLMASGYPITLCITSHWNHIICSMIESFELDIGLVTRLFRSSNIITKPIFSEKLVMISHVDYSDYGDVVNPQELDVRNEIKLDWGQNYELWHNKWWIPEKNSNFKVDIPMLTHYLIARSDAWSIVPLSVAYQFSRLSPIRLSYLTDPIPDRVVYQLTHRIPKPGSMRALKIFDKELAVFLAGHPDVSEILSEKVN